MTKETFKKIVKPDGTEYIIQHQDEIDKNHGPDDTDITNQGRMYGNEGTKNKNLHSLELLTKLNQDFLTQKYLTLYLFRHNPLSRSGLQPVYIQVKPKDKCILAKAKKRQYLLQ